MVIIIVSGLLDYCKCKADYGGYALSLALSIR